MTFLSLLTCTALGFGELSVLGIARRGRQIDYVAVALFVYGGNACTNASLNYLSYPLRVMFKSSKLLPVELLPSVDLLLKRRSSFYDTCLKSFKEQFLVVIERSLDPQFVSTTAY